MKKLMVVLALFVCSACMPVNFDSNNNNYYIASPDNDSTPVVNATPSPSPSPAVAQVLTFSDETTCAQITDTIWARREGVNLVLFDESTCHANGIARSQDSIVVNSNLTLSLSLDPTSNTLLVTEIVTN